MIFGNTRRKILNRMLDKIVNILERLDFPVNFKGPNYAATSALFRDGDNPMAVLCYEDGPFDQIQGVKYTWPKFVSQALSVSLKDAELWLQGCEMAGGEREEKEEKIKIQKTLVEADYEGGVKSYKFFLDRGVSKETLDYFGCNLCQGGPMNGRLIFKIRDERGKLVGVAGRDALNRSATNPNIPRWKLKGSKAEWVYPIFERNLEAIKRTGQIIVVESIGDALSLVNEGCFQVLCNFGLHSSPARISYILKMNPKQIFLSLNSDEDKKENWGQKGADRIEKKLSTFFAADKIIKAPPIYGRGDFGEMNKDQILNWADSFGVKY